MSGARKRLFAACAAALALLAIPGVARADAETDAKLRAKLTAERIPDDLVAALLDPAAGYPDEQRGSLLSALEYLGKDRAVADGYDLANIAESLRKHRSAGDPIAAIFAARSVAEFLGQQCALFEDDQKRATLEAAVAALAKLPAGHKATAEARAALAAYHLDHLRLADAEAALGTAPYSTAQLIARSRIRRWQGRHADALGDAQAAFDAAPDLDAKRRAAVELATAMIATDKLDEAEALLKPLVSEAGSGELSTALTRSDLFEAVGDLARARGDIKAMRDNYQKALALVEGKLAMGGADRRETRKMVKFGRASFDAGDPQDVWYRTATCLPDSSPTSPLAKIEGEALAAIQPLTYQNDEKRADWWSRRLATVDERLGSENPAALDSLLPLAAYETRLGKDVAAETKARRALNIARASFGPDHRSAIEASLMLAQSLQALGRVAEAQTLLEQASEAAGRALPETHPAQLRLAAATARLHDARGRAAKAQPIWAFVIETMPTAPGIDEETRLTWTAQALENQVALGGCFDDKLFAMISAQSKKLEGPWGLLDGDNLRRAMIHYNYAEALMCRKQFKPAENKFAEMRQSLYGVADNHPQKLIYLARAAERLSLQPETRPETPGFGYNNDSEMLSAVRDRRKLQRSGTVLLAARNESGAADGDGLDIVFTAYLNATQRALAPAIAKADGGLSAQVFQGVLYDPLIAEAFTVAQDLQSATAARALAEAVARARDPSGALARLVEQRRDAAHQAIALDRELIAGNADARAKLGEAITRVETLSGEIATRFPDYAGLSSPAPLALAAAREKLKPDEAILLIVPAGRAMHMFGVSKTAITWRMKEGGVAFAEERIVKLRCEVDEANCAEPPAKGAPRRFSADAANDLHREFVAPVESGFAGAKRIYVASAGPLSAMPLSLLRTAPDMSAADGWLADRYTLMTLPAVSSLRLREQPAPAPGPYLFGVGDPVLTGTRDADEILLDEQLVEARGDGGIPRANPGELRTMEPLPGTRVELEAMARSVSPLTATIKLGSEATEAAVKQSQALAEAQIVVFATHGLLPRSVASIAEPGLVFTPPATATPIDDGLLTASEAASLRLAASLIILSACNTASPDGRPGGESLSGLARAFLFAGAGSILASHWQIGDDSTAALTSEMLRVGRAEPDAGWGAALAAAERALRTGKRADGSPLPGWKAEWGHPAFWAPFALVGQGF